MPRNSYHYESHKQLGREDVQSTLAVQEKHAKTNISANRICANFCSSQYTFKLMANSDLLRPYLLTSTFFRKGK